MTGPLWFHLAGDLGVQNRKAVQQALRDALYEHDRIVLDLRASGYVDSTGLEMLVSVTREAQRRGAKFELDGVNEDVQALLRATRLDRVLVVLRAAA